MQSDEYLNNIKGDPKTYSFLFKNNSFLNDVSCFYQKWISENYLNDLRPEYGIVRLVSEV